MTNRLTRAIAQLGWLNALLYLCDRALAPLSGGRWGIHKYQFVAQRLGEQPLCANRGRDIDVRLLASRAAIPPGYPRPANVLDQRYAQGAISLAAFRRQDLVGFLWLLFDAYQEDEVRARYRLVSSGSCWDFDVYVRPEDRLGWAFRRLWDEARCLLRARAVRWSCSRISAFNPASLAAHARIGTVPLGSAVFLRCGNWQWMLATLAPHFHCSRHPASYPQLLLDTSALDHHANLEPPCRHSSK